MTATTKTRSTITRNTITRSTVTGSAPARNTARAEDTRRRIYESALELFREKGFEQTTMRDIASKTGVALGGAYYYFASKEAIVLAFYEDLQESTHEAILEALQGHKKLKDRLRCVLQKRFELLEPNRKFCDALFRHAPDAQDPLSPFSEATRTIRDRSIEHLRVAAEGGDIKVPADLAPRLPHLLWLYQLALILFWLYDRSPRQERTQQLMEKSLGFLVNLLRISALPLMKPLRRNVLELLETVASA
ncbi:MAG TPA: TetR family transcriptional regulator [Candidatus Saccharimonadales bacterium]|jgi:AcrR family transcriptional regulator|nr:TetR family transcriptional regulator [Candidatus Saccharimonadales bacterium]